jgi:hypothetical protein
MGANYINYAGPPNSDIWEVGQSTTDVNGNQWLCTGRGIAPQSTTFRLVSESGAGVVSGSTLTTSPPNSASVYAPASYTANTASVATVVRNTLGYDAQFTAYFQGAASVATFQIGVGSSATPAMTTVATSNTSGTIDTWPFTAYVPTGYYFSWQVSQANGASVPSAALTIVAFPI